MQQIVKCSIEDLDLFRPVKRFVKKKRHFRPRLWSAGWDLLSAGKIGMDWEYTPRKFNMKIGRAPKGDSSSNHHFSVVMLNFGSIIYKKSFEITIWLNG